MDLAMFKFTEGREPIGTVRSWAENIQLLSESAQQDLGALTAPTAASMFMRRYGLFVAGHLAVFATERKVWTGSAAEVEIVIGEGEPWLVLFQLSHDRWEMCGDEGIEKLLERLVDPVV